MRWRLLTTVASASLLLLGTSHVAGADVFADTRSPGTDGLRISASSGEHVAGSFSRSGTTIGFEATSHPSGRAEVSMSVGDRVFAGAKDVRLGSGQWSGNGAVLTAADRAALAAFSRALTQRLTDPSEAGRTIPGHHDVAVRFAMLLAEAPAGVRLGTHEVPRPPVQQGEKRPMAGLTTVASCMTDARATTEPSTTQRRKAVAACQQSDEDGILYTPCDASAYLVHDYDSHCLLGESVFVGPSSGDCMAKCGPGCGPITGYTYDCGDHDRCNRAHSSQLGGCSDEFWEADDDFWWSSDQCG